MYCRDDILSVTEIGQFAGMLQPGGFKELIEDRLTLSICYPRTNDIELYILALKCNDLVFNLFDVGVLRKSPAADISEVFVIVEGVFDWFGWLLNNFFLSTLLILL